eukprot:Pgem_evm1s12739
MILVEVRFFDQINVKKHFHVTYQTNTASTTRIEHGCSGPASYPSEVAVDDNEPICIFDRCWPSTVKPSVSMTGDVTDQGWNRTLIN